MLHSRIFKNTKLVLTPVLSVTAMLCATGSANAAGLIFSPVGGVINSGGPGSGTLADTYNQNGLTTKFVSGVSDFDTYLAPKPTHTNVFAGNEWFSEFGTSSATVTYDLGSALNIDRLALWNEDASGIGRFNLLASRDNVNFSSLAVGLSPFANSSTTPFYAAQVFTFANTSARYVRFEASGCRSDVYAACAIGEVAFSVNSSATAVPEPFTIVGTLVGGTAALRMRKRIKATNKCK
jgi:F5/8 type C domain